MEPVLSLKIISSRKAELRNKENALFNIHILHLAKFLSAAFSLHLFRSEPLFQTLRHKDDFTWLTVLQIHHKRCLCVIWSPKQAHPEEHPRPGMFPPVQWNGGTGIMSAQSGLSAAPPHLRHGTTGTAPTERASAPPCGCEQLPKPFLCPCSGTRGHRSGLELKHRAPLRGHCCLTP